MCLPHNIGKYLIAVGIMFFAFTTILGWNYYGERCLVYLTGTTKWIKPYKIIYIAAIALAPFLSLEPIWLLADITNALMIIPNLIAIIALRKVIIGETKLYFSKPNIKSFCWRESDRIIGNILMVEVFCYQDIFIVCIWESDSNF